MKLTLIAVLFLIFVAGPTFGATRYMSTSATDCEAGKNTDYNSVSGKCEVGGTSVIYIESGGTSAIKTAFQDNISGDTVSVAAGTYTFPADAAWASNIASSTVSCATGNAADCIFDRPADVKVVTLQNGGTSGITFQNISFTQTAAANAAVFSFNSPALKSITFKNCIIDNNSGGTSYSGFAYSVGNTGAPNNMVVTFDGCIVKNTGSYIYYRAAESASAGDQLVAKRNVFYNVGRLFLHESNEAFSFTNNTCILPTNATYGYVYLTQATPVSGYISVTNNLFVTKTGATVAVFLADSVASWWTADVTRLVFSGNVFYNKDGGAPSEMVSTFNGVSNAPIDETNHYLDPSLTSYASTTLSDITIPATSWAAGRGQSAYCPSGGDISGTAWTAGDVGAIVNPAAKTLTPTASIAVVIGDSMAVGTGASNAATTSLAPMFASYSGMTTYNTTNTCATGGETTWSARWQVDTCITAYSPSVAIISIGINDLVTPKPSSGTVAAIQYNTLAMMKKIVGWGVRAVYMGVPSKTGNPPDTTDPTTINAWLDTQTAALGSSYLFSSVLERMVNFDSVWYMQDTKHYYDCLTGDGCVADAHWNDGGHAAAASLAVDMVRGRYNYYVADQGYGTATPQAYNVATWQFPITLAGINIATTIPVGGKGRTMFRMNGTGAFVPTSDGAATTPMTYIPRTGGWNFTGRTYWNVLAPIPWNSTIPSIGGGL